MPKLILMAGKNIQIESLLAALKISPDNRELQSLVLAECLNQKAYEKGIEIIDQLGLDTHSWDPNQCYTAACLYYQCEQYAQALALLRGDEPQGLILKARILLKQGNRKQALDSYQCAIGANPALEDNTLYAELVERVVSLDTAKRGMKERTVANDDTDDAEVIRLLVPETDRIDFNAVGGLDDIKQQIRRKIITPFQKPSLFQRFKKKAGGGILLYGPPGCGKTLLARATAGECGATFYNVAISDILDMYIGESERKLHAIFEQARRASPAVLFFDEVEALGGKRQYTREATSSKLVSQFLSELDGFSQNNQGVLILAATNVPWAVDAAFRRPGRFDRVLFVPPPDRPARKAILDLLLSERPNDDKIDSKLLAKQTSGFSGADLRNLVETAVDEAIEESIEKGNEVPISQSHLKAAFEQVNPTTLEWLTTARNYARYSNEAGQYDAVLQFLRTHGKE